MATAEGQQHPLSIYFWIWGLLFVLSAASYATDFLPHGYFRWALILLFMALKAGFIVAIFMHMKWERLALIWAILGPPVVLLVLIGLMAVEGDYTELTRLDFFSAPLAPEGHDAGAHEGAAEAEAAR
jgi:cytochrome c oxidase subunit IV